MPCITVKTNCPVSDEMRVTLKAELGGIISLIPRKSEKRLLCTFDAHSMWPSGTDEPAAIVELQLFGAIAPDVFAQFAKQVTQRLASMLHIPPERIYCTCFETPYWGWNGNPL